MTHAVTHSEVKRTATQEAAAAPALWTRRAWAAMFIAVAAWVVWTSAPWVTADAISLAARAHVRQWSLGTVAANDADVAAAEARIRSAARISPDDPNLWEDLGEAQVLLAKRAGVALIRRSVVRAALAASAANPNSSASADVPTVQTLEEFRRRARERDLELQRQTLRGAAVATAATTASAPTATPSEPTAPSDAALKQAVRRHFELAREAYLRSIDLRPTGPTAWVRLAGVYLGLEQRALHVQAWRQALKLGPFEANVQAECLELVMLDWDRAEADQTEWAKNLYDSASAGKRKAINGLAARFGLKFESDAPATVTQEASR